MYFSVLNDDGIIETEESAQNPQDIEVLPRSLYYPFGMQIDGIGDYANPETEENRYLNNNKELHNDVGLEWAEYGARFYDPGTGRFTGVDPLAEDYTSINPFDYVANNPMIFVDPDGKK